MLSLAPLKLTYLCTTNDTAFLSLTHDVKITHANGNEDGSGDGAGTETGTRVETRERTQDGNGDGSGDGNVSSYW